MYPYQLTPEACIDQKDAEGKITAPRTFEGTITIDMPTYPERIRFAREMGMQVYSGEVTDEAKDKLKKSLDSLERAASVAEKIMPRVLEVKLKHLATGREISSVEALYCEPVCAEIITDLSARFILGFAEKN